MKTNMINEYALNQAKKHNPEITRVFSVTISDDTVKVICEDSNGKHRQIVNTSLYIISRHYQTKLHNEISSLNEEKRKREELKKVEKDLANLLSSTEISYQIDSYYKEMFELTFGIPAGKVVHNGNFTSVYPSEDTISFFDCYNRFNNIEGRLYTKENTENLLEFATESEYPTINKAIGESAGALLERTLGGVRYKVTVTRLDSKTVLVLHNGKGLKLGIDEAHQMGDIKFQELMREFQPK